MSTAKRSRPGWTTEAATKSMGTDTATLPKPTDRFPQPRRIGCVNGCEGFGHDASCDMALVVRRAVSGVQNWTPDDGPCSHDYLCKTKGIPALQTGPDRCPCWTGEDR